MSVPKWKAGVSCVNSDSSGFSMSVPWVEPVCWDPKFNSIEFVKSRFYFWDVSIYSAPCEINRPIWKMNGGTRFNELKINFFFLKTFKIRHTAKLYFQLFQTDLKMDCESPKLKFLTCFVSVIHVLIKIAHKPQTALTVLVSCFHCVKFIRNVVRFVWKLLTPWLAGAGWSSCGLYTSHASSTEEFLDSRTLSILTFPRDKILYVKNHT